MFVGCPGSSAVCMLHICTHSGGCGRTGTFIAVSILLERLKTEGVVDVFNTVRSLRRQRPSMVQSVVRHQLVNYCPDYRGSHCIRHIMTLVYIPTLSLQDQYEFCYKSVLEFLDSFELYSNFK